LSSNYRPELDFSLELEGSQVNYYQGLIGVLRWIVELGHIDITVHVSLLSCYMASPHEGHLQQVYHIFSNLKQFNYSKPIFDDVEPTFTDSYFHVCVGQNITLRQQSRSHQMHLSLLVMQLLLHVTLMLAMLVAK
jgi:hypothetical protein